MAPANQRVETGHDHSPVCERATAPVASEPSCVRIVKFLFSLNCLDRAKARLSGATAASILMSLVIGFFPLDHRSEPKPLSLRELDCFDARANTRLHSFACEGIKIQLKRAARAAHREIVWVMRPSINF